MSEVYALAPGAQQETHSVRSSSTGLEGGSQQVLNLLIEPQALHHADQAQRGARFALCSKSGDGQVSQDLFEVSRLEWVMQQIHKMPERDQKHFWISQSTLAAGARNRRISSIIGLNAVWCDIDLAHAPATFKGQLPAGDLSKPGEVDRLAGLLAIQIQDAGLPPPSYVIATGGGLCPKWLFDFTVPSVARARWQSLQNEIVDRIGCLVGHMGDAEWQWPVDRAASDAARVLRLVGSFNPRWNTPCRIAWESGKQYSFDAFADQVLPYTREEVIAYREAAKAGAAAGKQWTENRAAADAAGIRTKRRLSSKISRIEDEAARGLWTQRFEFGRALLEARGGACEGSRNNHFWPLANALAHSCSTADQLLHELAALHHSHFKTSGWTRGEAVKSAGSVISRLKQGQLYRMTNETFMKALDVTASERKAFGGMLLGSVGHNANRDRWNIGTMGFLKMKGLSSDDFIAETRRRQALAGARSAEVRSTTRDASVREKAILMRSSGIGMRKIAAELHVAIGTVHKWCSAALAQAETNTCS